MELYRNKLSADIVLNVVCTVLKLTGLWTPFDQKPWIIVLYKFYGVIFQTCFCGTLAISLAVGLFSASGMRAISSLLPMTAALIDFIPKLFPIYLSNRKMQKIRADVESFDLWTSSEECFVAIQIGFYRKIVFAYGIVTQIAIAMYAISSIADRRLMYDSWLPGLNITYNNRAYWLVEAYQYFASVIASLSSISIDLYYCLAMYVASVELKLLGDRLSSMQAIRSFPSSKQRLVDHVTTLRHIKSLADDVEYCVGLSYIPQVILSALSICSSANELAKVRKKTFSFPTFLQ